jgi:predicted GNAT superfamily acetyltransferase
MNGFYLLESWKIAKNNNRLLESNIQLAQNIVDQKNQNSFEALDQYKEKILKRSGYRKSGEQIFDISQIDNLTQEESDDLSEKNKNNPQKWFTCLFGKNKLIVDNTNTTCR